MATRNGSGNRLTYDAENRLTAAISGTVPSSYVYDGDGVRVSKTITVSGVVTKTFYVGNYYELTASGGVTTTTKYYYMGAQRIAMKQGSGNYTYLHLDHLGSTNASSGAIQSTGAVYFPFGSARAGNPPTDYTYTGQKMDVSDGLMYYAARYYDAQLGRFISADTIVPGAGNPQGLNRYSYVLNNPLRYTDPSGHCMDDGNGECVRETDTGRVILRESDWVRAVRTTEGIDPANSQSSFTPETRSLPLDLTWLIPSHGGVKGHLSFGFGIPLPMQPEIGLGPAGGASVSVLCTRSGECGSSYEFDFQVAVQGAGGSGSLTVGPLIGWGASSLDPIVNGTSLSGGGVGCVLICGESSTSIPLASNPLETSSITPYIDPVSRSAIFTDYFGAGLGGSIPELVRGSAGGGLGFSQAWGSSFHVGELIKFLLR